MIVQPDRNLSCLRHPDCDRNQGYPLAVYVAIGGIADIRSMLHHMHPDSDSPPPSEP